MEGLSHGRWNCKSVPQVGFSRYDDLNKGSRLKYRRLVPVPDRLSKESLSAIHRPRDAANRDIVITHLRLRPTATGLIATDEDARFLTQHFTGKIEVLNTSEPRSAYVHVPFCVHRCGYCDFTVVAGKDGLISAYLDALEIELHQLGEPRPVDTLFLGGGTPTHLKPKELSRLMNLVRYWFPPTKLAEISVEANPADLDVRRVEVLANHGVNRISLGVQAFDDQTLAVLERDHRKADIQRTWALLRQYFDNISLDLIFGAPGQSLATWKETLAAAADLQPTHVSTYGLTYEKGTRFWSRREKGELNSASDEIEREMYLASIETWKRAGLEQYEISSFARPGFRCRHNQVYWTGQGYFACGPGAVRLIRRRRESNHRSVTTWLNRLRQGLSAVQEIEELSDDDWARELIVLGLRRCDGIEAGSFRDQTGQDLQSIEPAAWRRHLASGMIEEAPAGHFRLTQAGRFVADSVIVDFL